MKILFVNANNRSITQSISTQLYDTFLIHYKKTHPTDSIIELNLFHLDLPYFGNDAFTGIVKMRQNIPLLPDEQEAYDTATDYLNEFLSADKIVFSFPLWNNSVPAVLHTYIDYLNRPGTVYRYTPNGPVGLITDKKVMILHAIEGNAYSIPVDNLQEMAVSFLVSNLNQFGIEEIEFIAINRNNLDQTDLTQKEIEKTIRMIQSF